MPIAVLNPITASPVADATPGIAVTPQVGFTSGTSATPGAIASFAQNGRLWTMNLTTITGIANFRVRLFDTNLVASNVIAVATNNPLSYQILPGVLQGTTVLESTSPVGLPTMASSLSFRIGNTTPAPHIADVSPVIVGSGATVMISGANFINVTRVGVGEVTIASFTVLSPSSIRAVLPASVVQNPGNANALNVSLSVTAQGGSTASVTTLTFILPPTVLSFSPTIGSVGTPVRIVGTRLGGTLYNEPPQVWFGGVPARSVVVQSPSEIIAVVPQNATSGTIRVSTPGGTTATLSTFTFIPPPRITEITPNIAPQGALVTVFGTSFVQVSQVRVGGVVTQFTQNSINRLTLVISTGATGVVEVLTATGIITSATIFTFAPPPLILSATPSVTGQGGRISIQGFGFVGTPIVEFGTITAPTVSVASISTLSVAVPSLEPGRYPVTLRTPGGVTTSTFRVTVVPAPVITGFHPPSGTTGTVVEITGRNFAASTLTHVSIAGVTASSVRVVSDTLIIARVGRISSSGTITVVALGGSSTSSELFVNRVPPPVITAISTVVATSGTLVTVWGEHFDDANRVQIVNDERSVTIRAFTVVTSGQLTFVMPADATTGTIVVGTSGGTGRSPFQIQYMPPPSITLLEPSFGKPGTTFIIHGENLSGVTRVLIGTTPIILVRRDSPARIVVQIPVSLALGFDLPLTIESTQGTTRIQGIFSVVNDAQADSLALVELYRRTGGNAWRRTTHWLSTRPLAEWIGVTVAPQSADSITRGRVTSLSLPENNMRGTLPSGLQFLTELRTLNLAGNTLSGTFPDYIPSFRQLEVLNMAGLQLSGSIPDSIGALRRLRVLNIRDNVLSGRIPASIQHLQMLQELHLNGNMLSDSVPNVFDRMTELRIMRLNNNRFRGALPLSFGNMTALEELNISSNAFSGVLPDTLRALRNIQMFAAERNQLEGVLPLRIFRSFERIRYINLGYNRFTGVLPPEIQELRRLRFLSLRNNRFVGVIPEELSTLDSLETLLLDSNAFAGALPSSFERFVALARLSLAGNRITSLPNLLRIRRLSYLNVANNSLDFRSLEPNALIDTLIIAPQDSIGQAQRIGGVISIPVRLSVSAGGVASRYQWFRQTPRGDSAVSTVLRDSVLSFPFASASSGTYVCKVTNTFPELRSLTLISRPIRLDSVGVPLPPREVPVPQFPIDSITNITTTASLSWTRTTDASVYDVQLVSGQDTLNVSIGDTAYPLRSARFETVYSWRVRGRNVSGVTAWSAWNTFVTVARNVDIAAVVQRFPRTPIGDEARREIVLISNTSATITLERVEISDSESSFTFENELSANFPLQPGTSVSNTIR
ncbi:MAG: hypothetical protein NZ661_11800, partial [Candidatus Kapabacteria bacterium]|nr:hypothetical protein [Candidatus Kapabacteria bacterium]